MTMKIQDLAQLVSGRVVGDGQVTVDSITLDSREVTATGIFAALPGTRTHGASFAQSTPAAAVLTDPAGMDILRKTQGFTRPVIEVENIRAVLGTIAAKIYGHPTQEMTVIGITGTSGKTTTSYLLEAGLLEAGKSVGLIGTTGTRINRQPVPTKLTTPEAPKLQELFATMRAQGVTHVVMEVSSHAVALGRVQGTKFSAAGFTNLSQDHLDFHPTMEDYFEAKAALFSGPGQADRAVICVDDSWGKKLAQRVNDQGHKALTISTLGSDSGNDADIQAYPVAKEPSGAQQVQLRQAGETRHFHLPLPGPFNVANAALAIGLAEQVGVDRGQPFMAVVDYAHKPAAVAAVLDTLRQQLDGGRIGVVVGAGGDRDTSKRAVMGSNAASRADLVIVTDDNPRTEDPAHIRAQVLAGARQGADQAGGNVSVREIAARAEAIAEVVSWAQPGDAVIVVGKGHEVGQIYGEHTYHFDDREQMAQALEARGFLGSAGDKPKESQQ